MTLFKRALLLLVAAIAVLAAIVLANAWRLPSRQLAVAAVKPVAFDQQAAAQRLATSVTFKTISFAPGLPPAAEEFKKLHEHLARSFPKLHAALKREVVGELSLLYTWAGTDPAAKGVLLMAHQDVVPIAPGTEGAWTHDPFEGVIKDGFIWGRGAWDDKGNLMSMLEAVELLVAAGHRPRQTIYLAFGHDEEIGGLKGAKAIADLLRARGAKIELALDEGLLVSEGLVPGIAAPVALIGIAEKGYLTLELETSGVPGHSSMPSRDTAIGKLSRALARLEEQPFPARLTGVAQAMYGTLAPEMSGLQRILLANLWLFEPLVKRELAKSPSSDAAMRTTTALTVLKAGEKENVLPGRAQATINFRILPGETIAGVVARVRQVAGEGVTVRQLGSGGEPSPVSPVDAPGFRAIARSVREVFPGTLVAPGLMIAATDTRHVIGLAETIYRFSPTRARKEDLARFHGNNERISISNYAEMIAFYHRLIAGLAAPVVAGAR
jgi:carboxypeptidase PM20D1